ncbi:MAG TPA: hypothetical protein PKH07_13870, partial [bacterium]|nr:hypothetical protein [bacterium]
MKLTDVSVHPFGAFLDTPASFAIHRYDLPRNWDYIYTNANTLLRINHDGTGYLQVDPPAGPALFKMERLEK